MHRSHHRPRVAVVGSGVAGLVAARRLAQDGMAVSLFEATDHLGGQIRTIDFDGLRIDVGAEALHAVPPMLSLITELGLHDQLVAADDAMTWIWDGRRLRPLPAGVGPAGPTRLWPVLTSRILSPTGLARAGIELLLPRSSPTGNSDESVGHYLTRRFGSQVTQRLVDPVLGSLHAGDVNRLSMGATAPQLAQIVRNHRSLTLAHRARRGSPPSFFSFANGLATFTAAILAGTDVKVSTSCPVTSIRPTQPGFTVTAANCAPMPVDAVVLAIPAATAARLLEHALPQPAWHLSRVISRSASVATAVVAYHHHQVADVAALSAKGMLVTSTAARLLKAATFLSTKWPHLRPPGQVVLRLSAGRAGDSTLSQLDDDEAMARLRQDLADATGITAVPIASHIERWPETMAQLEVGHPDRVRTARQGLERDPLVAGRLVMAGASYDGLGIAACVRSGETAAGAVVEALTPTLPTRTAVTTAGISLTSEVAP